MLAGGNGVLVLFVPPSLRLLCPHLGIPLQQRRQLLCLALPASVRSVNLIVLARAVQSLDKNGRVFDITVYLYHNGGTLHHRRGHPFTEEPTDIIAVILTGILMVLLALLEIQKPSPVRWSVFNFCKASLNEIPLSTLT